MQERLRPALHVESPEGEDNEDAADRPEPHRTVPK